MKKWSSYADDLIFAGIDLGGGFKSPEQVGLDLAKTAATAVISMGCSSAGSAVGKVADASLKGAGKVLAKAGISAATSYATSVGTSFINNWNFDADGNLKFDADNFGKSTYSAQTIAGSVGAGVTAGLTTAANMKMQKMGDNGAAVNKFYGTAINAGISAAGKLSEYAVYSAYALAEGRSLKDAYDDMGGLTFNIGSLGMFADMMASGIARNNATGQAGKFGEIAQKLEGKGILEINIGSNGIKGKFGMGGFDLAGSLYTFGKRMSDKAALEAYAMQEGVSQEEAEAAYWGYVYGDWTQENTMARICSRRDELHIVDKMADGANAQTVQNKDGTGRLITMKDTGDYHTNAVTLGHESYRDGIVGNKADQQRETFNAVLGHTLMEARMLDYGQYSILEDENIRKDLMEYAKGSEAFAEYVNGNYDSSADYWKLMDDGSLAYDGKATLVDEQGNVIKSLKDMKLQSETQLEGALLNILGIDKNDKESVEKVRQIMAGVFAHTDAVDSNDWYWISDEEKLRQNGQYSYSYESLTNYNMGRKLDLNTINLIFLQTGAVSAQMSNFIKEVYNSPINMLMYTDFTSNSQAANTLLHNIYTDNQIDIIQYNKTFYKDIIENGQDISKTMFTGKVEETQPFGVTSDYIATTKEGIPTVNFLIEDHPAMDFGNREKDNTITTPGGYWTFLNNGNTTTGRFIGAFNLYGSDLNMRINHMNSNEVEALKNNPNILGSSTGGIKLFNFPTTSNGTGDGAHAHIEYTRLLPRDGRAYVPQYVNPNTLMPSNSYYEYYLKWYDINKDLITTTNYARTFGR